MTVNFLVIFSALTIALSPRAAEMECVDSAVALEYWRPIKQHPNTVTESADALAVKLLPCLGSPDPELRDQIAYELYVHWLRKSLLTNTTRQHLLTELSTSLRQSSVDESLKRSFSALILAELMRSDGIEPFMSDDQREVLLRHAAGALEDEQDFRGLDAQIGWIHPVAHISDVLWRFALHPATGSVDAEIIMTGIRSKIAPATIAYHFNESDRLARVVSTILDRGLLDADGFDSWIETFVAPNSMERWADAFRSTAGMNELHNTKQFLRALSDQLNASDVDENIKTTLNEFVRFFTQLV